MDQIKSGSHSRMGVFEQCKFRAKLAYVDKIPEPERPLPPGKSEHANDRGTRIHEAAEKYVKGGVELIPELEKFQPEMDRLREMFAEGKVSLEGEWAYTESWEPVAWMSHDVWMRIKCDAVAFTSAAEAVVIDYKSGKRWGNEVKHSEQMQLYQLGAFHRYPKLEKVRVELWYTDQDELHGTNYTRDQGLRFAARFEKRMKNMTDERDFPPNPNAFSCRWCPYKPVERGGTGHCSVGV
jgi:RecB family exonuclease